MTSQETLQTPELTDRQKQIFAPLPVKEEAERITNYDYLFSDEEPEFSIAKAAIRHTGDRSPTEQSISAAKEVVVDPELDESVKAILDKFSGERAKPEDIVHLVQSEATLRSELARYFLGKIDADPGRMPERVARNGQKNPNHLGYPSYITCREYAALLAISMLDGSFKQEEVARADDIEYAPATRAYVIRGQHRAAANLLLHEFPATRR